MSTVINGSNLIRIRYKFYQDAAFIMAIEKEELRQIIKENDLKSVGDVYALLKDSFKELL